MTSDPLEIAYNIITTFPFNLIIVIAIISYIVYIIYTRKPFTPEVFEIEDFRESVYLATEKLMKTFGLDLDARLTRGIEPIGYISKYYHFKGKVKLMTPDKKETAEEEKKKTKNADLYIFQLGRRGIFEKLFGGVIDYVIVNSDQMETYDGKRNQWGVKENVSFMPYGNVFISSKESEAFINDVSFRRSQEEILTHVQNFPRKVAYLELKQAKVMERFAASIEKKKTQYDKYKKDVLGSGKDLEEAEEED